MTPEATDLVARLQGAADSFRDQVIAIDSDGPTARLMREAATLIEAQAAEIEEAHQIISDLRNDDNDWRVMTPDQRRRSDAFLASRTERAAIETTRAGSTLSVAERTNPHSR